MPSQGQSPQYIYNNDYRGPWQQPPPGYMDDRYHGGQHVQMMHGQQQFQGNPQIPGYRGSNWLPNNYHQPQQFNNYVSRGNSWNTRNHGNQNNPGPSTSRSSSRNSRSSRDDTDSDTCFICRDLLQNCEQLGIHLCDGGKGRTDKSKGESPCEIHARLEIVLEEIKASLKEKHENLESAINTHVSTRIGEIEIIHKHAITEKEQLQNLKKQLEERASELETMEKALKEKETNLIDEKDKFNKEMTKEKEEICRQWQQLRDEIARMEEMHEMQKGRIRLDVGGTIYTTSLLTLVQDPESMLAAMFSGRHEMRYESDGTVFIDRDGTHFRYILNYLRDGCLKVDSLPRNRQVLRELRNEAVYYQLHSLLQQIEKLM